MNTSHLYVPTLCHEIHGRHGASGDHPVAGVANMWGTAPVALPASTLGVISSSAVATTTFASASAIASGGFLVAAVLSSVLTATIAFMGLSLGWFSSPTNASAVPAPSLLAVQEPAPLPVVPHQAGAPVKPFIMVVKTDQETSKIVNVSNPNQFMVPLHAGLPYDFTINWGDGTIEVITKDLGAKSLNPTHTYGKAGTYTVQISENKIGGFPAICFREEGDCEKLREIAQWGGGTWSTMESAFSGCRYLSITATDAATALTGNVSNFSSAWSGCNGLTSFPLLNTSAGTNFSSAWFYCNGLTSFPLLNTSAGTNFSQAWRYCLGLTSFPLLNTSAGTNFSYAWSGSGLTSFPLLITSAGTNFSYAWNGCQFLASFPLLDTSAGTNFSKAWSYCYILTSFPLLDTSAGTDFGGAWEGCIGLTSFPLLNTSAGTDFIGAWSSCRGLTSFPLLNFGKMEKGDSLFSGVTLTPASYGDLLGHIASVNSIAKVTFDGGFSKLSDPIGIQARETLIKKQAWTIYDGDFRPLPPKVPRPWDRGSGRLIIPPRPPVE